MLHLRIIPGGQLRCTLAQAACHHHFCPSIRRRWPTSSCRRRAATSRPPHPRYGGQPGKHMWQGALCALHLLLWAGVQAAHAGVPLCLHSVHRHGNHAPRGLAPRNLSVWSLTLPCPALPCPAHLVQDEEEDLLIYNWAPSYTGKVGTHTLPPALCLHRAAALIAAPLSAAALGCHRLACPVPSVPACRVPSAADQSPAVCCIRLSGLPCRSTSTRERKWTLLSPTSSRWRPSLSGSWRPSGGRGRRSVRQRRQQLRCDQRWHHCTSAVLLSGASFWHTLLDSLPVLPSYPQLPVKLQS